MEEKPKRRWLRFRLRTAFLLFAALSVPCVGLYWYNQQLRVARQRMLLCAELSNSGCRVVARAGNHTVQFVDGGQSLNPDLRGHLVRASGTPDAWLSTRQRLVALDYEVMMIRFHRHLTDADRKAIEAFPEAEIYTTAD